MAQLKRKSKSKSKSKNAQASRARDWRERLRPWWPRLGKAGLALVVLAALAGVQRWSQDPRSLPMRKVQIEGQFRFLSHEQLQAAVTPHVRGGFFNLDVVAVQDAALALSWVDQVTVRRVWPDTVRIRVREQRPLARWGRHALLNERGEVFDAAGHELTDALAQLHGPEGRQRALLKSYRDMEEVLTPLGLRVHELQQDERRSLELKLSNGVELRLGRDAAQARLQRFVRAYPGLMASRGADLQAVDLRYSNGFAVRWQAQTGREEG